MQNLPSDSRFLDVLHERVVVADGAMGTMLQDAGERGDLVFDDFAGLEGCNEILNDTRPDVVAGIHRAYFAAGADAVETNTFGANLPNLADYDIADRIRELAEKGAPDRPGGGRRDVERRTGRGSCSARSARAPSCRRWATSPYAALRDAYAECGRGLIAGGSDALVVETCQDLLQVKAAVLGAASRAMAAEGRRVPIVTHVTVETTGTMLLGSEIGAALTAIEPLGRRPHRAELRHRPRRDERAPAHLSQHARIPLSVMPNAGLPQLGPRGAVYPLTPDELAEALTGFVRDYGLRLVGGCCGTTPAHVRAGRRRHPRR